MELNVLENTKKRMVFEIIGADHTICNILKSELWNDDNTKAAAYSIAHPLKGIPKFIIETSNKDAKDVLKNAISKLKKNNKAFLEGFKKA